MKKKNPAIPRNMPSEPPKKQERTFKVQHEEDYWFTQRLESYMEPSFFEQTQEPDHE